ncbi:MAG TPA: DUF418 domain-containing protein [Thermoanaerobaculia bacterium]|nr:DUF418 domain-containing protein [Thermoanaerobaculia bacterium]
MTTESLAPVAPAERVETIDILRGLALFGILAANIRGFAGPAATYFSPHLFWPALHDRIAQAFIDTFVQGKFIAIFAFLFGVGFAVQLERADGRRFGWTYARRLLILLGFGLAHGLLIWFGDILLTYALTGFVLILFRKRRDKTLLMWASIAFLLPLLLITAGFIASRFGVKPPTPPPVTPEKLASLREIFAEGAWVDIQQQRMKDTLGNWAAFPFLFWRLLALFLFGVLTWRRRLLQPPAELLPRYRRVMAWALGSGVVLSIAATALRWMSGSTPSRLTPPGYAAMVLSWFGTVILATGYVCAVILLCNDAVWRARLRRFGCVGRMALTNYLLQSIVGTLIFYNYGLGFFGSVGPAVLLPLTVLLYAIQVAFSGWWLRRFRFGPAEWLWRSLTYGRRFALVEASPAALPRVAGDGPLS